MSSSNSPSGSVKRHSRNVSYQRPRRSTRGPLDAADDPLSEAPKSSTAASPVEPPSSRPSTDEQAEIPEPEVQEKASTNVDLRFLKDPTTYHQLGIDDVPTAFLESSNQPPSDTPLTELLQHGHFRRAAGTSLIELTRCPPDDGARILQLLYTRLACLVLISRADLASVEAASLTDFLARNTAGAEAIAPLMPWELRILLVRLQSIASADGGRRGIMALYALCAEVRAHAQDARDAEDEAALALWAERLRDLGMRVADTLVEMGELETATRHLDTLEGDEEELAYRKALLRLRIGDVTGARRCIDKLERATNRDALDALLEAANGLTTKAVEKWQTQADSNENDALSAANLAVGLLYTGQIAQARQVFEEISQRLPAFPGLLFNLGTVYELCTEQAIERKTQLAQTMASKPPIPSTGGWERANFEFKL